jgi:hypothetical protein
MNKAIHAIHYVGLTLKDFRGKTKAERSLMWCFVIANISWDLNE